MTKIYYDTEFLDDGQRIDLISVGMVSVDGRELYAVSSEFDQAALLSNPWMVSNVLPSLPWVGHGYQEEGGRWQDGHLDLAHPDVKTREQIRRDVAAFILETPEPELWARYGAYDFVALCQLWGRMIDLPPGIPMRTNDLQQEAARLGVRDEDLPRQSGGVHNALADARHNKVMADYLEQVARGER